MTSNVQISTATKAVEVVIERPNQEPATTVVDPSAAMTFYISEDDAMHIREVPAAAPVEPEVPQAGTEPGEGNAAA